MSLVYTGIGFCVFWGFTILMLIYLYKMTPLWWNLWKETSKWNKDEDMEYKDFFGETHKIVRKSKNIGSELSRIHVWWIFARKL